MASGFDSYKNGLMFGALVGAFAYYASTNITQIGFFADWMDKIVTWITTQTWFPASMVTFQYYGYVIAAAIGAVVGIYIDKK